MKKTSRKSLRLLGTVGEPINPEAWEWYYRVVGDGRCPIVDTWWQTETGGILITPLPGATKLKPGSATLPFFGVKPAIVDGEGKVLEGACEGNLVIADSWPGQMRTVYGDHERFVRDLFLDLSRASTSPATAAGATPTATYWITGRVDDVINVSGHRMGTAEVESALVAHPKVSEAAVVGYPHDIKGQGIYAYVTLMAGETARGAAQGARRLGAQGDRPDRLARPDPVRAGPAEDALRQDHAPHPAQDRRGRVRQSRRPQHPRPPRAPPPPPHAPTEHAHRGGGRGGGGAPPFGGGEGQG